MTPDAVNESKLRRVEYRVPGGTVVLSYLLDEHCWQVTDEQGEPHRFATGVDAMRWIAQQYGWPLRSTLR